MLIMAGSGKDRGMTCAKLHFAHKSFSGLHLRSFWTDPVGNENA